MLTVSPYLLLRCAWALSLALLTSTCLTAAAPADERPLETQVFQSGKEGYHTFRIPAIVRSTNGTLLAFAEGRKYAGGDTGAIDLVLKRSFDNGVTWGPMQRVDNGGDNTIGNPTPLVDGRTGRILLLTTHNGGKVTEAQILAGEVKDRRVFIQASANDGATWSAASEITATAKRQAWRYYATGPVHGIQLARGPHAGRLIAPCNHSTTNSSGLAVWGAHLLYSDDAGATWRIGAVDTPTNRVVNPNECAAVELTDGRVYAVARNEDSSAAAHRVFACSRDAGLTFEVPFALDVSLVSPVVQGSVLRYSAVDQGDGADRILFSAPGDPLLRAGMTIRSSFDESRTWSSGKVIYKGPSAYSDMVKLPGGWVGLLYESGVRTPYERITFAALSTAFLDTPDPALPSGGGGPAREKPSDKP
jgi:Neuraminidase (sialidase)